MMKIKSLSLLALFVLFSCASIPKQTAQNNSAIAITISADVRSGLLSVKNVKPEKVYFIKLNSTNDSLLKNSGIVSEYNFESWLGSLTSDSTDNFLFDVEPGIYAAVAAYGQARGATGSNNPVLILFPEKMIKSTILEVKPNTIVYAGKYILDRGSFMDNMKDADEIQKYYYKPLIQKFREFGLITISSPLKQIEQSKQIEIDFLKGYSSKFSGTDWEIKLKNRLKELE